MKSFRTLGESYARWVITGWILALFLRVFETLALNQHHYIFNLLANESIGLCFDLVFISAFVAVLFPFYYLLFKLSLKTANVFMGTIFGIATIAHLAILQFFIQTSTPLGGMLIGHTINEVFFTIRTSGTNFIIFVIISLSAVLLIIILGLLLKKCRFRTIFYLSVLTFAVLSIFIILPINHSFSKVEQEATPYSLRINKSYYFYHNIYSILKNPYFTTGSSFVFSEKNELFPDKKFVSDAYPLLSRTNFQDVLGAFLSATNDGQPPNIVIIIVEGLGSRFLPDFKGIKLMPFLDSLAQESLYWDKALTVGERSYSVVPSLLASAPYGNRGFTFEKENLLSLSLVNMLSKYNYYSTCFYGQPQWFHNKGPYLRRNGLNKFVDCNQFPEKYQKIIVDDYFWGHHDQNLVNYALELLKDSMPAAPRLDIYFTGSMHPPFAISQEELYNQRFNNLMAETGVEKQVQKFLLTYRKYLRSVLFTDDALRILFEGYKNHPAYQNTIFIITGDHPMTEVPIENSFMRYRVPIIIYSPLLNQTKKIHSVNSHLDVAPALLAFLHHNYNMPLPDYNAFIGKTLDTVFCFQNTQPIVFMNSNRLITDILYENYFLLNEKTLFKVYENDIIERIEDNALKETIFAMLQNFKSLNSFCCNNNRLIPDTLYYHYTGNTMLSTFERKSYYFIKNQEFGYPILDELSFSGAGRYYFDFCVKEPIEFPKEMPALVVELIDKETNERISWNGFNLDDEQGFLHFAFEIDHEKEMVLKAYFWNNKQISFELDKTKGYFYRLTKHNL